MTENATSAELAYPEEEMQKTYERPNEIPAKILALGTRMAVGVINKRQLISIVTGVVRANNPNLLKEYGGDLVLSDKWARGVLEKLTWSKRKGTTGKVDLSPQFLAQEKFSFQRTYQHWFLNTISLHL